MCIAEKSPDAAPRLAQLSRQLQRHLAHCFRLVRQFGQIIAIKYPAKALEASNLFNVMRPKRWGGYGVPLTTSIKTLAELAKGCGSTGWVAMIVNGINWWASRLPDAGQEEIFAKPGTRLCAAGGPTSKGRRVEGGVRISGRFPFASRCWHASWGGLSAELEDDSHNIEVVTAFAPMTELEIEDTWHVAGMCGTGSNTLVADDVFVPDRSVLK
jgi:3-hydroxy-9,10-secoandrosta-1,3,5(10)-triene-9,17-dione monooxygenase